MHVIWSQHSATPRVVLAGHSHRPKFITLGPGRDTISKPFDFADQPELVVDLPSDGCLLVDTGNLGRAEFDPLLARGHHPAHRRRYGTYAIIDFERSTATLCRHAHEPELGHP